MIWIKAVGALHSEAIENGELIHIYGDYDADELQINDSLRNAKC